MDLQKPPSRMAGLWRILLTSTQNLHKLLDEGNIRGFRQVIFLETPLMAVGKATYDYIAFGKS